MPVYVARWEEVTENGETSWVPLGVGDSSFAAIDLTPPGAAPWRCIFRSPAVLADVPGRRRLSEPGERLTTLIRNRLGNDLGITLEDRPSLAEVLAHILLDHAREDGTRWRPLKPERDGAMRIHLGGRVWEMLPIRGGATITDDFNRADNTDISTGAPFSWTEVQGDWTITTNGLQIVLAASGKASVRAESDLASDDHYAQLDVISGSSGGGNKWGPMARFSPSATTGYLGAQRAGTWRLDKIVANSDTLLAQLTETEAAKPYTMKTEVDGSTLRLLIGGVEKLSVTDTAIVDNLRTGIWCFNGSGGSRTDVFDNFSAADLAGGPTNLVIQDATHAHSADTQNLTQVHELAVQEATHSQAADSLALTQVHNLITADSLHAHAADNIVLAAEGELDIAGALHAHSADNVALSQVHELVIQEASHGHLAEALALVLNLGTQDALHGHSADAVALTQLHLLVIADALHGHEAEVVTIGGGPTGAFDITIGSLLLALEATEMRSGVAVGAPQT